ncbi:hypothetical protein [Williamsia sp. M5A3_1d]
MKKILGSTPVLGFLFLFNLAVAVGGLFVLEGFQQIAVPAVMAVISLGAGGALLAKHRTRRAQLAVPVAVSA